MKEDVSSGEPLELFSLVPFFRRAAIIGGNSFLDGVLVKECRVFEVKATEIIR
jgi:hypothetical protein